jgi:adenosylcobinamide amidohydrolase
MGGAEIGQDVRMLPELIYRSDDGRGPGGEAMPLLVWRLRRPLLAVSSAPAGGGIGPRSWVVNATVPMSYPRTDPDRHLAELADREGLAGRGVGMLTGVDVADRVVGRDGGVTVVATVGIGTAGMAAAADGDHRRLPPVGTINLIGYVPRRLSEAALVNAVYTVAEAKAQALWSLGIEATGTATDAICVLCGDGGRDGSGGAGGAGGGCGSGGDRGGAVEPFAGPRSVWGARLARAVFAAVTEGGAAWRAGGRAWSEKAPPSE